MSINSRILIDAAQTPNTKTRQATLKFLTTLATTYCTAAQFVIHSQTQQLVDRAILKIIQTALDQKSADLKSQARFCIAALYNCNPSQVSIAMNRNRNSINFFFLLDDDDAG